jgi:hypothetical protein
LTRGGIAYPVTRAFNVAKMLNVHDRDGSGKAEFLYPNIYGGNFGQKYKVNATVATVEAMQEGYVEDLEVTLAVLSDELGRNISANMTFALDDIYMVYADTEDATQTYVVVQYARKKVRRFLVNATYANVLIAIAAVLP